MRIVVDKNIPFVSEIFRRLGEVVPVETGELTPRVLNGAEALIVRSETEVNAALLDGSNVRFVGTATIGFDHIDTGYLASRNIQFASAPGCNANAVAEYVMAALLTLAERTHRDLRGQVLGIVGFGNVGSKVAKKAESLGMKILLNDPPLARVTGDTSLLPLDALMEADIVSLHVPLTAEGSDPTFHLFGAGRIARMKPGSVLINTSRGGVVNGKALAEMLDSRRLSAAIVDVWENEPLIDTAILDRIMLGTAHIAGYSLDGKVNAARMMYNALCHYAGADPATVPKLTLHPPDIDQIFLQTNAAGGEQTLGEIVRKCYDIERDDKRLRGIEAVPRKEQGKYFRQLRAQYPVRREFFATTVVLPREHSSLASTLRALGFTVRSTGKDRS